jgi:hypothetical protein
VVTEDLLVRKTKIIFKNDHNILFKGTSYNPGSKDFPAVPFGSSGKIVLMKINFDSIYLSKILAILYVNLEVAILKIIMIMTR